MRGVVVVVGAQHSHKKYIYETHRTGNMIMTVLHHPLEQFLGAAQQVAIWVGEEESGEAVLWEGSHRGRNASLV